MALNRLRLERGRAFGDVWLGFALWRALQLDALCRELLPEGRETVSWSAMAAVLVIARLCEPASELHLADDWYRRTAHGDLLGISGERINDDRLYRAHGVEGSVVAPFTGRASHRVRIDAKAVVLAAGCMATPVLLQKSGNLANASQQVGENLQFHPGVAVMGIFPDPVDPQFGATQGYQSLHFVDQGYKLETLWAPPAILAVRLPGSGQALKQRLSVIPFAAIWDAIASCNRSLGRVRPRRFQGLDPRLTWHLHPDDVPILARSLYTLAEIFFAAGAHTIIPGVHGVAPEMRSLREAEVFLTHPRRATDFVMGGNHAFCTTRMHGDPTLGVVDELGRCHGFDNLYIADTGVFPQCPSVNPMWTLMALARRTALAVADSH